jgi:hypothetical protein
MAEAEAAARAPGSDSATVWPTGALARSSSQWATVRRSWMKATIPGGIGSQKAISR